MDREPGLRELCARHGLHPAFHGLHNSSTIFEPVPADSELDGVEAFYESLAGMTRTDFLTTLNGLSVTREDGDGVCGIEHEIFDKNKLCGDKDSLYFCAHSRSRIYLILALDIITQMAGKRDDQTFDSDREAEFSAMHREVIEIDKWLERHDRDASYVQLVVNWHSDAAERYVRKHEQRTGISLATVNQTSLPDLQEQWAKPQQRKRSDRLFEIHTATQPPLEKTLEALHDNYVRHGQLTA